MYACNEYHNEYRFYEYKFPIDKFEVNEINISISDIYYKVLSNVDIKIYTRIKFRF